MLKIIVLAILSLLANPLHPGNAENRENRENRQSEKLHENFVITHFNLIFAPDLSNRVDARLYKRPLTDCEILSVLTNDLYPSILRAGRSENQKDRLNIDFINRGLISEFSVNVNKLSVDFSKFDRQIDRISYILDRDHPKQTLRRDITAMNQEFDRVYDLTTKRHYGADVWSYFNDGIDDKKVLHADPPIAYNENSYLNTYRNILILPTDGYIEAGIYNKGFDCSKSTVDHFRKAFLASGEQDMETFLKKNKSFQIKPVSNNNLANLEVLVLEMYDRSLSKSGSATVHPTDMEILKVFWSVWLRQSKVKRFELHPYAASADQAEKIILDFMGIKKIQDNTLH